MNILEQFYLKGKTALLAFPESPYGKEAAAALCEAGAELFLASDDGEAAGRVREELIGYGHGAELMDFAPDSEKSITELKEKIIEKSGKLDIFVLIQPERYVKGWTEPGYGIIHENLRKNQMGAMLMTKVMGDEIAKNKAGSVIFISSVYALAGPDIHNTAQCEEMFDDDFSIDMAFTAGGYVNYARQASSYLGQYNVRTNTICIAPLDKPDVYAREFARRTTLLRNARGEDIKGLLIYLASDSSAFLTGATIPLDGGYSAK